MSEDNQLILYFFGGGYVLLFLLWRQAAIFLFNAAVVLGVCFGFGMLLMWLQEISPWLAILGMIGMIWFLYSVSGTWRGGDGGD